MSMPGRGVANLFWAQAVNQDRLYLQICIYKSLHGRPCRSCRTSQIVPTMLLCPARIPSNVPTLFGNRNLRSYDPTHALADLPVEIWRLDSMPISQIPSDVLASVPHNKTGPSATWKFRIQIFQLWTIACHSNDQSVCKRGVSKGDPCTWCTGHWRSTPLKRQHGQKFLMHQIFHAMFNLDSCSADYSFRERSGFHTRGPWKQAA